MAKKKDRLVGLRVVRVKRNLLKDVMEIVLEDGTVLTPDHSCYVDDIGTAYINEDKDNVR